jgi:hypothetical protein
MKRAIGIFAIFCALCVNAGAQEYRGRVEGLVTDSTGAVVPGAKLTLQNVASGVAVREQSNGTGNYQFNFVEPGNYVLTTENSGFSKAVQENIEVAVQGTVTVNVKLALGRQSETVTVTAAPPDIDMSSATLDMVVPEDMVKELPQPARNPFGIALIDPALRYDGSAGPLSVSNVWGSSGISMGGASNREVDLLVDGSPTKLSTFSGITPSPDAVEEFAVVKNSADAEFGSSGGGAITLVTKSGTNEWHGSAMYEGISPGFNAHTFVYRSPSVGHRGVESGALGNPILKRKKLFTFNAYERWHNVPGNSNGLVSTQPTDLERQGDFSQSLNSDGTPRIIYDPTTSVFDPVTNAWTRQPFPGNKIPQDRIDKTAAALMTYFWKPNRTPTDPSGTNNFQAAEGHLDTYWSYTNRTDWTISDKLKVYGHYAQTNDQETGNGAGTVAETNYYNGNSTHNKSIVGDAVYTINSRMVLDGRFSYSHAEQLFPDQSVAYGYTDWINNFFPDATWPATYYQNQGGLRFPALSIGGEQSYGNGTGWQQYGTNYIVQPKLSMTVNNHNMKIGADIRRESFSDGWPSSPNFTFSNVDTSDSPKGTNISETGDGYASFLLGGITNGQAALVPALQPQEIDLAIFFEDDYKLSSRVTLNLGLRVDRDPGPVEADNHFLRYWDPNGSLPNLTSASVTLPADAQAIRGQYNIPTMTTGGVYYADSSHRRLYNAPIEWQPRVGVAVKINEKTSLHATYARWAVPSILTLGALNLPQGFLGWGSGGLTAQGFTAQTNAPGIVNGKPATYLDANNPSNPGVGPFVGGLTPATGSSQGIYSLLGDAVAWNRQDYRTPLSDRFNISIQRELPWRMVAEISGLYHYGSNMQPLGEDDGGSYTTNYNIVDPQIRADLKGALDVQVPNPYYGVTALAPNSPLRTQANVNLSQLIQPYPYYTGLTERGRPGFHNKYTSIEARVTKHMANHVDVVAIYDHELNRQQLFLGGTREEFLNKPEYDIDGTSKDRFTGSFVVALPFGRGQLLGRDVNQIVDRAIGGWKLGGIYTYTSGAPIPLGDWALTGEPITTATPAAHQWFNPGAFAIKTDQGVGIYNSYALRSAPAYMKDFNYAGYENLDATLTKVFPIREKIAAEFHLTAINAPNNELHTQPEINIYNANFGYCPVGYGARNSARSVLYNFRVTF